MKHWKWILPVLVVALAAGIIVGVRAAQPGRNYAKGVTLRQEQHWDEAIAAFTAAGDYLDAAEQISETRYRQAEALRAAGDYEAAYAAYMQVSGYRDADVILAGDPHFQVLNAQYEEVTAPYRNRGAIVTFGRYEQDGDADNGPEPIEWIVLDEQDGRVLLLSRYGLDCVPYHSRRAIVTWEKSSLRHWLNREFLAATFDEGECQAVCKTRVDNSPAQGYRNYSANSGSDTMDMVFLLSYAEAWKYLPTNDERKTTSTAYAQANGAYCSPVNGHCWWWLRSNGNHGTCAANVHYDGKLGDFLVHDPYAAVRPAIWVDLRSPYFSLGEEG